MTELDDILHEIDGAIRETEANRSQVAELAAFRERILDEYLAGQRLPSIESVQALVAHIVGHRASTTHRPRPSRDSRPGRTNRWKWKENKAAIASGLMLLLIVVVACTGPAAIAMAVIALIAALPCILLILVAALRARYGESSPEATGVSPLWFHSTVLALSLGFAAITYQVADYADDLNAYRAAQRDGHATAFRGYIDRRKDGRWIEDARRGLDDALWTEALAADSATSYRTYLDSQPQGKWREQAEAGLAKVYDAALIAIQKGPQNADRDARRVVTAMLGYARGSGDFRVAVQLTGRSNVSQEAADAAGRDHGVYVDSVGDAFSEANTKRHEREMANAIASGFMRLMPEDVLTFVQATGSDQPRMILRIEYTVESGGLYLSDRQERLPQQARRYVLGIKIRWRVTAVVPGAVDEYSFDLRSEPADRIEAGGGESFGHACMTSAVSDLEHEFGRRFGIAVK